ncbi:hypothetical protein BASA50_011265 [Batrachochytrium salamandrivorans]|uniref:DUF202 domain-containing protein n=1 Tax=Batrachochytrium salamandrivorans TaxID=1357716 RepID=A0ABQ8EWC1_9FUNG|nr:hypothetical protein BASA62_006330 [Batrachochytrium salamandrivorans]KAH6582851.1 hypothetical protein BASA60_001747 [Batrachochytrium salamandrivorans]KAH6587661.1 hypothetical protein BASA50_011265 [Batrachochytrium salamandrivorans]KAH9274544.1 hypothetical protein BASA83_003180 [Batrachochytrium salamandrivorans]
MASFLTSWFSTDGATDSQTQAPPANTIPPNPKVFFANERTFLSWLQLCLVLGAISIGLLNFSGTLGQATGIIFAIISIAFMFYTLIQFNIRANRLQKKEKGVSFEDMTGALVMITVVFVALALNFSFRMANPAS